MTHEADLVLRLCERDPLALAEAYDSYPKSVYSLLLRLTRDSNLAEDLTQELVLRLWNRARLFHPERGSLPMWLLSVARNLAIDHMRSSSSQFQKRWSQLDHTGSLDYTDPCDEPALM